MIHKNNISINFIRYDTTDDFDQPMKRLYEAVVNNVEKSYAPYSKFHVCACALLASGQIVMGHNIENVASPVCICAERTAISNCIVNHPDDVIEMMAIFAQSELYDFRKPVTPCGSCRQVLVEIENKQKHDIKILLCGKDYSLLFASAHELLPFAFE